MAIINNAQAGSQINLLCMIYRILNRNNGKLSVDELLALCRPDNLSDTKEAEKRFPKNVEFWMQPEHQLWYENEESKLTLSTLTKNSSPLPKDIANVVNTTLFKSINKNICDEDNDEGNDTKVFFRCLACILASERFVFSEHSRIDKTTLSNLFADYLPFNKPPNDSNEKLTLIEYGYFLGFLEKQGNGYLVDPTRAILGVLPEVFPDDQLSICQFIEFLGEKLPVLDSGIYRKNVEKEMTKHSWKKHIDSHLSKSLSHALFRLSRLKKIRFLTASDDTEALSLILPNNKRHVVSSIQYINGDNQ